MAEEGTTKHIGDGQDHSVPVEAQVARNAILRGRSNRKQPETMEGEVLDAEPSAGRKQAPTPGISVTINMPAFNMHRLQKLQKLQRAQYERLRQWQTVVVGVSVGILLATWAVTSALDWIRADTASKAGPPEIVRTRPDFEPLRPSEAAAAEASTTADYYDPNRNLVSYTTSFSGARMTVSQQRLPDNFRSDPSSLQKAADSIKAKRRITTIKGPLYVGSNDESGSQMGVFAGQSVLVFIRADHELNDASWKAFIELLDDRS